jgi:hypothetical protein
MDYTKLNHLEIKLENGILFCKYEERLLLTLELAKKMLADRLMYQKEINYPVIILLNGLKAADKETRKYTAIEGIKGITMGAFVVKNTIEKIIYNFFFSIEKPVIPTKAFTNEEDAIEWIRETRSKL